MPQEKEIIHGSIKSAYDILFDVLNSEQIRKQYQDKKFYHLSTKEEYIIKSIERVLDNSELIVKIESKDNKIKRIKIKELNDLIEIKDQPDLLSSPKE